MGCSYIQQSMIQFLASETGLSLTRASISHYEAFYELSAISQKRIISPEMLASLTQNGPNSSKMHATIKAQAPSYYSQLMSIINAAKEE
eukprot:4908141-Amphidinium_carterae.1